MQLTPEELILVLQAITVHNNFADFNSVKSLLEADIDPENLQERLKFLQDNGFGPNHVQAVVTLLNKGFSDQQLIDVKKIVLERPQDLNLLIGLFYAIDDSETDLKEYYDFWISQEGSD